MYKNKIDELHGDNQHRRALLEQTSLSIGQLMKVVNDMKHAIDQMRARYQDQEQTTELTKRDLAMLAQ